MCTDSQQKCDDAACYVMFPGARPHSRRAWRIKSFWRRKRRKRRSTSSHWGQWGRSCHGRVRGRRQQRLHRGPVPVLLQPGAAPGGAPGGVSSVPAQPASLPLPTPLLLCPPDVLRLPPSVPAHRDFREPGVHRVPAVPWDSLSSGCPSHPGWSGAAGAVWGVPAETFPGFWSGYSLVSCTGLQVRIRGPLILSKP